jgi:hypothetical protein
MANLLERGLLLIRSKRQPLIVGLIVLVVAVGAAVILGPHPDSGYNNIIPSGSE